MRLLSNGISMNRVTLTFRSNPLPVKGLPYRISWGLTLPIRIDRRAVGFPGDPKERGVDGWESTVAIASLLATWKRLFKAPRKPLIAHVWARARLHQGGIGSHEAGHGLHGLVWEQRAFGHHGFPIRRTTRRLAARDPAKQLAGHPDLDRVFGGHVRPQGIEVIPGDGGEQAGILQGRPTQALQGRIAPSIGATRGSRACEAWTMTIA